MTTLWSCCQMSHFLIMFRRNFVRCNVFMTSVEDLGVVHFFGPVHMISGFFIMTIWTLLYSSLTFVLPYLTLNASVVKTLQQVITYVLTFVSTSSDVPGGIFAHLQSVDRGVA